MVAIPDTAHLLTAVALLREATQQVADHVVARAQAAYRRGATAEAYRASALELNRQADRAERLLFGQAVKTFRAAAAKHQLIADALDVIESRRGLY